MVIGVLQVELGIDGAESLKDKRRVTQRLRDRLPRAFGVSVAEVDQLDNRHVAVLGMTLAARDVTHCRSVLDKLLDHLRRERDCYVMDETTEVITGTNGK